MRMRWKYYEVGRTVLEVSVCPRVEVRGRRTRTFRTADKGFVITKCNNSIYCREEKHVTKAFQVECPHLQLFGRKMSCPARGQGSYWFPLFDSSASPGTFEISDHDQTTHTTRHLALLFFFRRRQEFQLEFPLRLGLSDDELDLASHTRRANHF
jgi:hypothetical protein